MKVNNQFESGMFERQYHYNGFLGARRFPDRTEFRLWAPMADGVILRCYPDGTEKGEYIAEPMARGERGVWVLDYPADLDGVYYDYEVITDGVSCRTADPYAHAGGANGIRSMVLDLRRTDPEHWEEDTPPEKQPEDIIYEVHIKDFSYDPASGVKKELQGKYGAFWQKGTTLNGDGVHPTGLDYLKRLGVTHIQLMPSFDYGSVDELGPEHQFNWGYDPVNYNIPEGSYSSDPTRGEVRIRELKTLIQTLHQNGLRVIMDVVYNHTYELDSCLWRTAPGYYYRSDPCGNPSNGSGCGNDLASERSMCARYIRESVLFWAKEYHIDGFRFDLMGLLDVPLMNSIQRELDDRYGEGEKLLFGEPWAAAHTNARAGTRLADKKNLRTLNGRIGAFCDATRDAIKGSLQHKEDQGFVNGGGMTACQLRDCLEGWSGTHRDFSVLSPAQTITYVSSHDDWTLWDKLVLTMGDTGNFSAMDPRILRANRLAAAIYFCCQGHLFLLSGEEFGRTKEGVKNTFESSPELNRLDWNRAWENEELVDYYRGLIALRKQLPGLCSKSIYARQNILRVQEESENCVSALIRSGGERWKKVFAVFSAREDTVEVQLPGGEWECLVDGQNSFLWQMPNRTRGAVTVPPQSALLFGQIG